MKFDIGKFDRLITICRKQLTIGRGNSEKEVWTKLKKAWAQVKFNLGSESMVDRQLVSIDNLFFEIRNDKTINAEDRILFEGKVHLIESIVEGEVRNKTTLIKCILLDSNDPSVIKLLAEVVA